jgi:hypothetical protein
MQVLTTAPAPRSPQVRAYHQDLLAAMRQVKHSQQVQALAVA